MQCGKNLTTEGSREKFSNKEGCIRLGLYCCSVAKLRQTLCDPVYCSMPGFPVLHYSLSGFGIRLMVAS